MRNYPKMGAEDPDLSDEGSLPVPALSGGPVCSALTVADQVGKSHGLSANTEGG